MTLRGKPNYESHILDPVNGVILANDVGAIDDASIREALQDAIDYSYKQQVVLTDVTSTPYKIPFSSGTIGITSTRTIPIEIELPTATDIQNTEGVAPTIYINNKKSTSIITITNFIDGVEDTQITAGTNLHLETDGDKYFTFSSTLPEYIDQTFINVIKFGADRLGGGDSTPAFTNADASDTIGVLIVPPGSYNLDTQPVIPKIVYLVPGAVLSWSDYNLAIKIVINKGDHSKHFDCAVSDVPDLDIEYIDPGWFGVNYDGTDEVINLQKAYDTLKPGQTLRYTQPVLAHDSVRIPNISDITIDFGNTKINSLMGVNPSPGDVGNYNLYSQDPDKKYTDIIPISNLVAGDNTLEFTSSSDILNVIPGDLLLVKTPSTNPITNEVLSEFHKVKSKSGAVLTLDNQFLSDLEVVGDSVTISVYETVKNIKIKGGSIHLEDSASQGAIQLVANNNSSVKGVNIDGTDGDQHFGVWIFLCANTNVEDCDIRNFSDSNLNWGYGVALHGLSNKAIKNNISNCKHVLTTGSMTAAWSRNIEYRSNVVRDQPHSGLALIDMHDGVIDGFVIDNECHIGYNEISSSAIGTRCSKVIIENNIILCDTSGGSQTGVKLFGDSIEDIVVRSNKITDATYGINFQNVSVATSSLLIENNNFKNCQIVWLIADDIEMATFINNESYGNKDGIRIDAGTITKLVIESNYMEIDTSGAWCNIATLSGEFWFVNNRYLDKTAGLRKIVQIADPSLPAYSIHYVNNDWQKIPDIGNLARCAYPVGVRVYVNKPTVGTVSSYICTTAGDQISALFTEESAVSEGFARLKKESVEITNDTITILKDIIEINTEASAATDDLVTISGPTSNSYRFYLKSLNSNRVITIKQTGNISIPWTAKDIVLDNSRKMISGYYWSSTDEYIIDNIGYLNLYEAAIGLDAFSMSFKVPITLEEEEVTLDTNGAITITKPNITIDTFEAAATDDLFSILGIVANEIFTIRCKDASRVIRIRADGGGNVRLPWQNNNIITLDNPDKRVLFMKDELGYANAIGVYDSNSSVLKYFVERTGAGDEGVTVDSGLFVVNEGVESKTKQGSASLTTFNRNGEDIKQTITNNAGNFDYTGGAFENIFTDVTNTPFTIDDENDQNWIIITSGDKKTAIAEIDEFIDSSTIVLHPMGWDFDLTNVNYKIISHPHIVFGDDFHTEVQTNSKGHVDVHSMSWVGNTYSRYMHEVECDVAAEDKVASKSEMKANGYTANAAHYVGFDSGDLGPDKIGAGIRVDLNVADAVSANAATNVAGVAMTAEKGTSLATTTAVLIIGGYDEIITLVGSDPIDMEYGYEVDGGVVIDRVTGTPQDGTAFLEASTSDVEVFTSDNDYILIGSDNKFEILDIILDTPSSQNIAASFLYSKTGNNWTTLPILYDTTNGFQQNGSIVFSAPGDWTKDDQAEADGDITNAYYIKIVRTNNSIPTEPVESYFKIRVSSQSSMKIRGDGTIKPVQLADVDAPNDSQYYSLNSATLVYKDSGGTVNALY